MLPPPPPLNSGGNQPDAEAVSNAEQNGQSCKQRQRMTAEMKTLLTAYSAYCHQPLDARRGSATESNLHEVATILYIDTAKL